MAIEIELNNSEKKKGKGSRNLTGVRVQGTELASRKAKGGTEEIRGNCGIPEKDRLGNPKKKTCAKGHSLKARGRGGAVALGKLLPARNHLLEKKNVAPASP